MVDWKREHRIALLALIVGVIAALAYDELRCLLFLNNCPCRRLGETDINVGRISSIVAPFSILIIGISLSQEYDTSCFFAGLTGFSISVIILIYLVSKFGTIA